ncbi:MAG: hypothetical protein WD708_05460 [Kiritimatiellia bacterium]
MYAFIRKHPSRERQNGSALLLTLLVVSLLLVITLAFVTYVRIELRQVGERQARFQAEQNAVLGVNLALSRLQSMAGPDQRATATASAISFPGSPGGEPRTGTTHWSGVWRAGASNRLDGREPAPLLLDWLVSGRETAATAAAITPEQYNSGIGADGTSTRTDEVVLVGPGTLGLPAEGIGVTADDFVVAPRVRAGEALAYAFWVGEENVKAKVNLPDSVSTDPVERRWEAFAPPAAPLNAMSDLGTLPRFDPRWDRLHSFSGLDLFYPAAAPLLRRGFHTLSLDAASVLSDAKKGGLKKDLSLAFELDDADFNRSEFARAMATNDPVRTNANQNFSNKTVFAERDPDLYTVDSGADPDQDYLAGPTWHYLRDFYRLYKQADAATGALSSRPMAPNREASTNSSGLNSMIKSFTVSGIGYSNESNALRQRWGSNDKILPTGVEVHPELQRLIMLYGLKLEGGVLHLVMEPVAVLHNPYNVPVEMPGMLAVWSNVRQHIRIETYLPGASDTNPVSYREPLYNGNFFAWKGRSLMEIMFGSSNSGEENAALIFQLSKDGIGSNVPVRFEPGEVKYFTSGLSRTEIVNTGDMKIFHLREGLDPATLFQGYGYAYPLRYHRRLGAYPNEIVSFGPLVLPPGGTVFGQILGVVGKDFVTKTDEPSIGPYGSRGGPVNYGGLNLFHLREDQLAEDTAALFFYQSDGSSRWVKSHTLRSLVPYADLRAIRLWNSDLLGGKFYETGDPKRRFSETELQQVRYFAANDLYLKPVNDDQTRPNNINPFEVLTQHNPRAPVAVPWEEGGRGVNGTRAPQTWSAHNRHLEDGRPDGVIGTGIDGQSGLWGDGMFAEEGGAESVVLYEVPRQPLLNLQQLGQANLSFWSYQPTYALGNSRASAYIERDRIWHGTQVSSSVVSFQYDNAYLLNETLWDGYFFSGVTGWNGPGSPGNSLAATLDQFVSDPESIPFTHPRLHFLTRGAGTTADAGLDLSEYATAQSPDSPLRPHNRMAQHLLLEGGFNVNSVSVDAWKAVLSGLTEKGVVRMNANGVIRFESLNGETAFGPHSAYLGGGAAGGDLEDFSGFRPLTPDEVNQLAQSIVLEIRERIQSRGGPFLSMGEFVNRRLVPAGGPDAHQGLAGVLQAAINRTDLNDPVENEYGIDTNIDGFFTYNGSPDGVRVPYVDPEAFADTTRRGLLRHLDQRAILSVIGSTSTIRSDTFRIRAYGSNTGDPDRPGAAEAWCEAVVQRMPEFVDETDEPASSLDQVGIVNQHFGRQFRILSFKWLSPDEL